MIVDTLEHGFRPQQIVGSLAILERRRHLLADHPGSGKTLQALFALELDGAFTRSDYATLILAPMTACQLTWAGELRRRIGEQYPDVIICDLTDTQGRKTVPSLEKRDDKLAQAKIHAEQYMLPLVVLANFESIRWKPGVAPKTMTMWSIEWDAVVIDESHLVLPTAEDKPTKVTQFWYGLMNLGYSANPILLSMSGTPDRGKLQNRYGHWKWFSPTTHRDYRAWVQLHFQTHWEERTKRLPNGKVQTFNTLEIDQLRDSREWVAYEQHHMTRRTKAEMLEGLPPKQWAGDGGIDLPMTPAQHTAYLNFMDDFAEKQSELMRNEEFGKASAMNMLFEMRSRQLATCTWTSQKTYDADGTEHEHLVPVVAGVEHSNKLAWLLEWLGERGYVAGEDFDPSLGKVVIVSFFAEVLHWLQAELANANVESAIMDGATVVPVKLAVEERFQRGDLRVVLLSGHLGVSINLDAADDMIFVDQVQDPDRMEQAEDRIHRASRNHVVTYWRLASLGTVDQATLEMIDARYRTTRAIYDGSRGVDFARKMLAA